MDRAKECHEQYPKDTKIVAIFLRDEGRKFGCEEEWLKPPETDGKNRSYILSVLNFKRIAEHLAKQSAFSAPIHIKDTLDRALELRIECNQIHEELKPEWAEANQSHRYAIRIFQETREILLPKFESGSAGSSSEIKSLSDLDEPNAAGEPASLVTVAPKLSFLMEGLKRIRKTIARCCSKRRADVNDGDLV